MQRVRLHRAAQIANRAHASRLARKNARVQRVALALLSSGTPDSHDVMFLTLPKLAAIARWDSDSRVLNIRCRTPLVLRQYDANGSRSTLTAFDGMQISLQPGQRLIWGPGQEMIGAEPPSGDQACYRWRKN